MTQIGRNEPCPCGSGKKYKKCCAENEASSILKNQEFKNALYAKYESLIDDLSDDEYEDLQDKAFDLAEQVFGLSSYTCSNCPDLTAKTCSGMGTATQEDVLTCMTIKVSNPI